MLYTALTGFSPPFQISTNIEQINGQSRIEGLLLWGVNLQCSCCPLQATLQSNMLIYHISCPIGVESLSDEASLDKSRVFHRAKISLQLVDDPATCVWMWPPTPSLQNKLLCPYLLGKRDKDSKAEGRLMFGRIFGLLTAWALQTLVLLVTALFNCISNPSTSLTLFWKAQTKTTDVTDIYKQLLR